MGSSTCRGASRPSRSIVIISRWEGLPKGYFIYSMYTVGGPVPPHITDTLTCLEEGYFQVIEVKRQ